MVIIIVIVTAISTDISTAISTITIIIYRRRSRGIDISELPSELGSLQSLFGLAAGLSFSLLNCQIQLIQSREVHTYLVIFLLSIVVIKASAVAWQERGRGVQAWPAEQRVQRRGARPEPEGTKRHLWSSHQLITKEGTFFPFLLVI